MKTKLLNIISIFTILVLATACGGDASSTPNTTNKSSSVNISVEEASGQNVYFSKTGNVDLKIASMKIDAYKTDDETDTDPSDNTLFNTKALSKDASTWKATLTALEIDSIYILDVTAKNTSGQVVSKGTTTQKIEKDVSNDVDIKLAQSSNLFDNPDELPTVNNILASQDANGKIELSFNIVNPNEESLTWSLFEAGGTSLSTEFAVNTGSTSNTGEFVKVVYTKDTNSNDTDYVLELKSTEGEIRYLFNIDFEGEEVTVTVNTPPIIESLNIVVEGDTLSITPVLDKESSDVTYNWSFVGTPLGSETITNSNEKVLVISGYGENSSFTLRLEVFENGSSSFREYIIGGHKNTTIIESEVQSIDEFNDNSNIVQTFYPKIISPKEGTQLPGTRVFFEWGSTLASLYTSIGNNIGIEVYYPDLTKTASKGKGDDAFNNLPVITYTKRGFYIDKLPSDGRELEISFAVPKKRERIVYKYIAYNSALKKAVLKTPSQNLFLISHRTTFEWDTTGAESYSLYIGTNGIGSKNISKYINLTRGITLPPFDLGDITDANSIQNDTSIPDLDLGDITDANSIQNDTSIPDLDPGRNIPRSNFNVQSKTIGIHSYITQLVERLPINQKLYVRLISKLNGKEEYNDYTYRVINPSKMKSPSPDATFSSDTVTFKWENFGSNKTKLLVGKSEGDGSYYNNIVTGTTQIVSSLPTDGSKIYVRLSSYINGKWFNEEYEYRAFKVADINKNTCSFEISYRTLLNPFGTPPFPYIEYAGNTLDISGDNILAYVKNIGNYDIEIEVSYPIGDDKTRQLFPNEKSRMVGANLKSVSCIDTAGEERGLFTQITDEIIQQRIELISDTLEWASDNISDTASNLLVKAEILLGDTLLDLKGEQIYGENLSCHDDLGNVFYASKDKFKNIVLNDSYSDINNYLMMQASAKTYPRQFKYRLNDTGKAETELDLQCAAKELYKHWGFKRIAYVNVFPSVNAIVASNDDIVVVAIRGTEDNLLNGSLISDVSVNAENIPVSINSFSSKIQVDNSKGKVHFGYARAAYSLSHHLRQVFKKIPNFQNKKVYITGHSLGGATAIMTSYFLQNYKEETVSNIEATYAFASPEVGDSLFTRSLYGNGSPYYMTINYRDPVPYVNTKPEIGTTFENFVSTLYASKYTNVFDANHDAVAFRTTFPSDTRNGFINSMFNGNRPYIIYGEEVRLGGDVMKEWHFHHVNFYVAYSYKKLMLDGDFLENEVSKSKEAFVAKEDTGIAPEFEKSIEMCIKQGEEVSEPEIAWSGTTALNTLLADEQGYPFEKCDD